MAGGGHEAFLVEDGASGTAVVKLPRPWFVGTSIAWCRCVTRARHSAGWRAPACRAISTRSSPGRTLIC